MRRFELLKIAKKIVKLENVIAEAKDPAVREKAEKEILQLTVKHNLNLYDMIEIDEIVQNMLQ